MFIEKYIQRIACFTMIVFMGVILPGDDMLIRQENAANEMRLAQSQQQKLTDETSKKETYPITKTVQTEASSPQVNEREGANPKMGKSKKFPILFVVLGVGVVAGLILLLGKKKKKDDVAPIPQTIVTYAGGVLTVNGVRYELVSIPAGEFQMGSNSPEADADEQPVHTVRISKQFWLGKTEVNQGLWKAVMNSNPASFQKGDNYPVETVSWDSIQSFISRLNQLIARSVFRVPTESEWEYACRAGTTTEHHGNVDAIAWYGGNSGGSTHPVGVKQANEFGLFDMSGNVFEWCNDWFDKYPSGVVTDPTGPSSGTIRTCRGGSFYWDGITKNAAWFVRSAGRGGHDNPGYRNNNLGLRLAADSAGN